MTIVLWTVRGEPRDASAGTIATHCVHTATARAKRVLV
jgi:hypothetical protein